MDDDRLQNLTRRIEHAGDRIVDVLKRVETEIGDRSAVEIAARDTELAPQSAAGTATPAAATATSIVATPPSTAARWRRFVFVSGLALVGTAVALRLRATRG